MENAVYICIGTIPLFYTICNGRDHGHSITHSQDLDVLMYSSKLHVRSCAGSFCVSTVHSIVLQHFNVLHYVSQLPSNSTTNSQRLSFSLLIILYCLFIVPECSIALFVYMSMSSALVLLCWLPAACLFVCLLVANGDIGLSPHIIVHPVMSHFLYHLVCGEC